MVCFRDFGRWYGPLIVSAGSRADIAYVEAVIGRVVAFAAHQAPTPFLVDTLDVISDRTRFDLLSEQRAASCPIAYAAF